MVLKKIKILLRIIGLFLVAISFYAGASAQASDARDANDKEKAAINKAVKVIVPLINSFENDTWQKTEGGAIEPEFYSVVITPDVTIATQPFTDWHFSIRVGSDFYNKNIKAYYDKMTGGTLNANDTKAMEQLEKEGAKIQGMSNLYAEVDANYKNIPFNPAKKDVLDLKIPGCFFAWKQKDDDSFRGTNHNTPESYVLAFGNWGNAKFEDRNYQFKFAHPIGTPFIENIVIIISGSQERIQELLKIIDWQKVNDALTR